MEYLNVNTNNEIKAKINDIRMIKARLNNLSNEEKKIIRNELHRIENIQQFTKKKKEKTLAWLTDLLNTLNEKEKYQNIDRHDSNYHGIRDIEHLLDRIHADDYYKATLTKSSFENNYEEYEIRGDKEKDISLHKYLITIRTKLVELINNKKNNDEQKIQLTMAVNFMYTIDINKPGTFYVKSDDVEIAQGSNTNNIIAMLFNSLLHSYYREEQILRDGSSYSFDCVDLLTIQFHDIDLNRGSSYIPSPKWISDK